MIDVPCLGREHSKDDMSIAPASSKLNNPPLVATRIHTAPNQLLTLEISPSSRQEGPVDLDGPAEMLKKYHTLIDEKWVLIHEIAVLEGRDELEASLSEVERLECYVCSMKSKVHGLKREARR